MYRIVNVEWHQSLLRQHKEKLLLGIAVQTPTFNSDTIDKEMIELSMRSWKVFYYFKIPSSLSKLFQFPVLDRAFPIYLLSMVRAIAKKYANSNYNLRSRVDYSKLIE